MVHEYAIAELKSVRIGTELDDGTCRLVTEHGGRFAGNVPRERVRAAHAARLDAHDGLAGSRAGDGGLLEPHIAPGVQSGNTHQGMAVSHGRTATLIASRRSARSNASIS